VTATEDHRANGGARRQVTVLFCDLVGSTGMAERVDPEVLHEILLAYHRSAAETIDRFGGSIGKFMGDGMLAYFGHPRAHEDDPRRAVLAGLELVDEVARIGREVAARYGLELAARVGVHTGLVVVAELGAGARREHDIVGASANVAYRIQGEADPHTVLISGATHELVRGYFIVSPVGARTLRGVSRGVELYRVLRPSGAESRLEAVRRRTPLVGREAERATLVEAWERARAGSAQTVLVQGEPGIGKSRLVEHLEQHVADDGGLCVRLQCSPYHTNTLLFPVARLLRQQARSQDEDEDDDEDGPWSRLRRFVEAVGPVPDHDLCLLATFADIPVPPHVQSPVLTAERRREELIRTLMAWLQRAVTVAPVLLVVEDLHWADPTSLDVLTRLAQRAAGGPLLMVFTARPAHEYTDPVPTLRLEPLPVADRERMVALLTCDAPVSPAVAARIVERSDGVPLYIEELARMLATMDDADVGPGPLPTLDIPATLHDLLAARLDQLPAQRHLAQLAATVGLGAPLPLLAALLSTDEASVTAALRPLVDAGLLHIEGGTCWFRHALLRDAAYQSQLRSDRRELHRRVAAALIDHFPEMCEIQPELLAEHFFESEQPVRAAEAWHRAGQRMAYHGAHTEATGYYRQALAALASAGTDEETVQLELSIQDSLGLSLLALNGYTSPQAEQAYARALELTARVEQTPAATTLFGLWAYWVVRGDHGKAMTLARESLAAARASGRRADILHSSCLLGYSEFYVGNFVAASELLAIGSGYDLGAEEIPLPHHPAVASLVNLAPTLWILGRQREARDALASGLELAEGLGPPWGPFTRAYAFTFAAWFHELAGDAQAAVRYATRAVEVSGEHGFPTWLGAGTLHLGIAQAMAGAPLESTFIIESALHMWRAAGAELFVTYYLYGLALARRDGGDHQGACRAIEEAVACAENRSERFVEAELHRVRGELLLDADERSDEGVAELWRAVDLSRQQGAATFELRALTSLHRARHPRTDKAGTAALLEARLSSFPVEGTLEVDQARAALAVQPA
jgi:class 3 adenylate cyclase/tetratricopeptide (TPR) repeat protein